MGHLQIIFHEFINLHNGGLVTASVAVVGGGEDSDNVTLMSPVVAVHDELMGTGNPGQVIGVVELLRNVLAERVAGTTGGDAPTTSVIGVGPEEIADRALMRSLLHAIELADLVEGVDTGRQTTVKTEHLVLNDGRQGKVVEQLSELLPHVSVAVLAKALIVETVPVKVQKINV